MLEQDTESVQKIGNNGISERGSKPEIEVGIPQALLYFDIAPMLHGFFRALKVQTRLSSPTNKHTIEESLKYAYPDSCLPTKLLHGHVDELLQGGADYILIPNAIRMAPPENGDDKDRRYACPLVSSAPYIIDSVFGLKDKGKLLDPVIDFSKGDKVVISSFTAIAQRLGFSVKEGERAIRQGLIAQRDFEVKTREVGQKILDKLADDPDKLGVVLLARSYNAQDSGANLGMIEKLSDLGVVPIPLDFLPLDKVNIREITGNPYWNYERKLAAAARIVAEHPQLFGLFISNYGCGPNSMILSLIEDIVRPKPLGVLSLDEHAAEAGYVTRFEAFVDTARSYRRSGRHMVADPAEYRRQIYVSTHKGETVHTPRLGDHAGIAAGAMRAFGVNARLMSESASVDERSMVLGREATSGEECLPFIHTLGGFLYLAENNDLRPGDWALMAGSDGPCRLGKYAAEQQRILSKRGIPLNILTTSSHDGYSDLGLGSKFELLAWQGVVFIDLLQKMLWMTRPYEYKRHAGQAAQAYERFFNQSVQAVEKRQDLQPILREAMATFRDLRDPAMPRRQRVGINGEIYLRANRFCNKDLVLECEANGLEVEVASMAEWIKYTTHNGVKGAWENRELSRCLKGFGRKVLIGHLERQLEECVNKMIEEPEPTTAELLKISNPYLPSGIGTEAVLSLASGLRQMRDPRFAGVLSVMPHGCMPGGIVAAIGQQISRKYGKPWDSLTYDGFPDKVNRETIADFAQQVKHRSGQTFAKN